LKLILQPACCERGQVEVEKTQVVGYSL